MTGKNVHIFIFRRDLRIHDNVAFADMTEQLDKTNDIIIPIFIFNSKQIEPNQNPYFSHNTVQFMIESLKDLDSSLKNSVRFFYTHDGDDTNILAKLIKAINSRKLADTQNTQIRIWFNRDITPYARQRDDNIEKWCKAHDIICTTNTLEYVLIPPTSMEKPYQVYGAYFKKYSKIATKLMPDVKDIDSSKVIQYLYRGAKFPNEISLSTIKFDNNPNLFVRGGRNNAMNILQRMEKGVFTKYAKERDLIYLKNGTTHLSAYLKYGCVSVREVYRAASKRYGSESSLVKELFWRSFYDQIIWHFPRTLDGQVNKSRHNKSLRERYDAITWSFDKTRFTKWCEGKTGFPIVDAGMRQLNSTGYMHNRVRMIVSSFLVKDMFIDWRKGEQYFATKLVDYYPSANNQGWTFASGSGADAQQYNRIFSPWLQSEKFDPKCEYIKTWVPELRNVPEKHIHQWFKFYEEHLKTTSYPKPIISHEVASREAKEKYKKYLK